MEVSALQKIDRYEILGKLGEGGMAVVYKALDTRLKRQVAIKLIRSETFPPLILDQMLKRFEYEATAMASLSHPNIVTVHDFGEYEQSPYLVMEYLPGGTLRQYMSGTMPAVQAAVLLKPVAEALAYAHSKSIVHRDVKPVNILFSESGIPKLSDFGIARLLGMDDTSRLTGTGLGVGTPVYMAPEQWRGQVSPAVDVYAFGVVFYEMLTGSVPFRAETPAELLIKIVTEPMPDPRLIVPDLSDDVIYILKVSLAQKVENRYPSMTRLINDLDCLIGTHQPPGDAVPKTPPNGIAPPSSLRDSLRAAESDRGTIVDDSPTAYTPPPSPVSTSPAKNGIGAAVPLPLYEPEPGSTRRPRWGFLLGILGLVAVAALVIGGLYWNNQRLAEAGVTGTAQVYAAATMQASEAAFQALQSATAFTAAAQTQAAFQTDTAFSSTTTELAKGTQTAAGMTAPAQTQDAVQTNSAVSTGQIEATQTASALQTQAAYRNPAPSFMIANYPLDTDAQDSAQKNGPMTLVNAPFYDSGVFCNGIYELSGDSNYYSVTTPNLSALNLSSFSIAADFKTDVRSMMPVFVGSRTGRWMGFYLNSDGSTSLMYNGGQFETCSVQYSLNKWHEALITYDGTTGRLYLDGQLGCSVDFYLYHNNTKDIVTADFGSGLAFQGVLGNLRVYDGVWDP